MIACLSLVVAAASVRRSTRGPRRRTEEGLSAAAKNVIKAYMLKHREVRVEQVHQDRSESVTAHLVKGVAQAVSGRA